MFFNNKFGFSTTYSYLCPANTIFMETLGYNLRDENEQFWFVMGSRNQLKELQIRDEARTKGLEAYVPVRYQYKTIRGQKQRKMIPAVSGYIFVKATTKELEDWIMNSHYLIFPRKSSFTDKEEFLTVPNHEMENFIAVIEKAGEHITYFKPEEIALNPGDKIRIRGGFYDGREGIITRIKGKRNKHLVVQIQGVLVAAVELQPELVQLIQEKEPRNKQGTRIKRISRIETARPLDKLEVTKGTLRQAQGPRERPSKNVDKDKKLLLELAQRLLFEIPENYQQENEYYLLLSELKRCRERLKTFKGYTAATEAELALPLYLAAVKLEENVSQAEERLLKAIEKLKDSSKLKALCKELLEKVKSKIS